MSNPKTPQFQRQQTAILVNRLKEPRRFIQVVAGARQVGKTTLVNQALERLGLPYHFTSADEPTLGDTSWLAAQWERARLALSDAGKDGVVLLGSAPLLVQQGLTESLAGRFEQLRIPHWSFSEMHEAFHFNLDQYLYFGGYPGAAALITDPSRWRRYLLDSLIETTLARDVLLMTRVDKPALLRRLFELGCRYSGQVLSYTKILGQLQDAGNTTTLAHYLELLEGAGMLTGVQKFAGKAVRQRGSIPKFQVLNTALMTAQSGLSPAEAHADREFRGRLVESAVGAHLANAAACGDCELFYWRERNREVDFVIRSGRVVVALEVKSGRAPQILPGLTAFTEGFKPTRVLLVGGDGIPLDEFLNRPVTHWLQQPVKTEKS
jgi:uncharacterized protein